MRRSANSREGESRIYAEDPYKDFLPSIGRLTKYSPPFEDKSMDYEIRNDTGVKEGDEIFITISFHSGEEDFLYIL